MYKTVCQAKCLDVKLNIQLPDVQMQHFTETYCIFWHTVTRSPSLSVQVATVDAACHHLAFEA